MMPLVVLLVPRLVCICVLVLPSSVLPFLNSRMLTITRSITRNTVPISLAPVVLAEEDAAPSLLLSSISFTSFSDEIRYWLQQQPDLTYRYVGIPPIISKQYYPTAAAIATASTSFSTIMEAETTTTTRRPTTLNSISTSTSTSTFIELERNTNSIRTNNNKSTSSSKTKSPIVLLHLIPTPTKLEDCLPPKFQRDISDYYNYRYNTMNTTTHPTTTGSSEESSSTTHPYYSKVIHLHQDVYKNKREIVQHRLMAQLGLGVVQAQAQPQQAHGAAAAAEDNQQQQHGRRQEHRSNLRRIYGRKTIVRRINNTIAMQFLDRHHLWGATKAKHNYGLFLVRSSSKTKQEEAAHHVHVADEEEELVAVGTFSARRKIDRNGHQHRSHELLRYCSQRDTYVLGGISKVMKLFITEKQPHDIVTLIDRDWSMDGGSTAWSKLDFVPVGTAMDPIVMVVHNNNNNNTNTTNPKTCYPQRRHLIGAGIQKMNDNTATSHHTTTNSSSHNHNHKNNNERTNNDRMGVSVQLLQELETLDSAEDVLHQLARHQYFPVYDTGVQRLMKLVTSTHYDVDYDDRSSNNSSNSNNNNSNSNNTSSLSQVELLWQNSKPTYSKEYYSSNKGISALLQYAAVTPSRLQRIIDNDDE